MCTFPECDNYKGTGKPCKYRQSKGPICAVCVSNNGDIPYVNEVGL